MRPFVAMLSVLPLAAACRTSSEPASRPEPAPPAMTAATPTVSDDAARAHVAPLPAPVTGSHLDDDYVPRHGAAAGGRREARPIDVVLRSTPGGAQAAVDGLVIGPTPAYWNGNADGREHEFTFVLPGHAIARYRFVPITSGTVHARLIPVSEDVNAGTPPPEVVPMQPRPLDLPPANQVDAPTVAPDAAAVTPQPQPQPATAPQPPATAAPLGSSFGPTP